MSHRTGPLERNMCSHSLPGRAEISRYALHKVIAFQNVSIMAPPSQHPSVHGLTSKTNKRGPQVCTWRRSASVKEVGSAPHFVRPMDSTLAGGSCGSFTLRPGNSLSIGPARSLPICQHRGSRHRTGKERLGRCKTVVHARTGRYSQQQTQIIIPHNKNTLLQPLSVAWVPDCCAGGRSAVHPQGVEGFTTLATHDQHPGLRFRPGVALTWPWPSVLPTPLSHCLSLTQYGSRDVLCQPLHQSVRPASQAVGWTSWSHQPPVICQLFFRLR